MLRNQEALFGPRRLPSHGVAGGGEGRSGGTGERQHRRPPRDGPGTDLVWHGNIYNSKFKPAVRAAGLPEGT